MVHSKKNLSYLFFSSKNLIRTKFEHCTCNTHACALWCCYFDLGESSRNEPRPHVTSTQQTEIIRGNIQLTSTHCLYFSTSAHKCFLRFSYTRMHSHTDPACSGRSSGVHVFHGVPGAPCVGPKYYTQTVAIASKPKIPHSTFLIPVARLLSWAPHEEPLLEREGSCISLAV